MKINIILQSKKVIISKDISGNRNKNYTRNINSTNLQRDSKVIVRNA